MGKEEKSMKVVMPRGREKETLDAKFDVMPYGGCACSWDAEKPGWLTTDYARKNGGSGYPCQCQCSGDARNHASNFSLGSNSSEW